VRTLVRMRLVGFSPHLIAVTRFLGSNLCILNYTLMKLMGFCGLKPASLTRTEV